MNRKVRIAILLVLFLLALLVLFLLKFEEQQSEDTFSLLQDIVNTPTPEEKEVLLTDGEYSLGNSTSEDSSTNKGLSDYSFAQLYDMNNHFFGWICIPNTNVNYPVMQNKEEKDYYLYKNFYKNYSSYGVPYIDERYDIDSSTNLLIYGHSMTNTTMFADLLKYKSSEFYYNNSVVEYTDKYGFNEYKIFSVFEVNTNNSFDYHNYINMDELLFNEFINSALEHSIYNTNIIPTYGDKLITLSTCAINEDDVRFVVIGVKVSWYQ